MKKTLIAAALAGSCFVSGMANAGIGDSIFVQSSGHVLATFEGQTAGYTSDLYLSSPITSFIFTNHVANVGDTVDLGFFTAGTELIFSIYVRNTGDTFYSGSGASNSDGLAHANVINNWMPGRTYVGFEDLWGGGDLDYDDNSFSFTNVATLQPVPEPETYAMLLAGLGLLGMQARRRKQKQAAAA